MVYKSPYPDLDIPKVSNRRGIDVAFQADMAFRSTYSATSSQTTSPSPTRQYGSTPQTHRKA